MRSVRRSNAFVFRQLIVHKAREAQGAVCTDRRPALVRAATARRRHVGAAVTGTLQPRS